MRCKTRVTRKNVLVQIELPNDLGGARRRRGLLLAVCRGGGCRRRRRARLGQLQQLGRRRFGVCDVQVGGDGALLETAHECRQLAHGAIEQRQHLTR